MAHFSVKQRRPFENRFGPSLRHRRQTASRCLANFYSPFEKICKLSQSPDSVRRRWHRHSRLCTILCAPAKSGGAANSHAAALRGPAAIVWNRRNVANQHNVQPRGGQGADGGFPSGTRALYTNFHALHAILIARHARGGQRSLLRGVRRALARAFEADRSSRGPAHGAAVQVGDRDLRVVERRSHVHEAVRDHATFALLLEFLLALCRRLRRRRTFRRGSRAFWFFCHDALRSFDCQILNLSKERHSIPCPPQPISLALL